MRAFNVSFGVIVVVGLIALEMPVSRAAQGSAPEAVQAAPKAPAAKAAAPKAAGKAPAPGSEKVFGNLAQIMRGIDFPDSNIIFDVSTDDPGKAKPDAKKVYVGWPTIEYAAVSILETTNLMLVPGRKCENGNPVPVNQADYRQWTQALIDAADKVYAAAKNKSVDQVNKASDELTDACANCHTKYRDVKVRCVP